MLNFVLMCNVFCHGVGVHVDFLKVLCFSFPVLVVGPSAKDFYHL